MHCDTCSSEITVYELYPRSYRLYVYACRECGKGFLAHHFDLNLEIYQLEEVGLKEDKGLVFIEGLRAEPRVFDHGIDTEDMVVIVADEDKALGELSITDPPLFSPYKAKSLRRIMRLTGLGTQNDKQDIAEELYRTWSRISKA